MKKTVCYAPGQTGSITWIQDAHHRRETDLMNQHISDIFEQIILLGNHQAAPDLVRFVDKNLSQKETSSPSTKYFFAMS